MPQRLAKAFVKRTLSRAIPSRLSTSLRISSRSSSLHKNTNAPSFRLLLCCTGRARNRREDTSSQSPHNPLSKGISDGVSCFLYTCSTRLNARSVATDNAAINTAEFFMRSCFLAGKIKNNDRRRHLTIPLKSNLYEANQIKKMYSKYMNITQKLRLTSWLA